MHAHAHTPSTSSSTQQSVFSAPSTSSAAPGSLWDHVPEMEEEDEQEEEGEASREPFFPQPGPFADLYN